MTTKAAMEAFRADAQKGVIALAAIESHEKLCTQRYDNIMTMLKWVIGILVTSSGYFIVTLTNLALKAG